MSVTTILGILNKSVLKNWKIDEDLIKAIKENKLACKASKGAKRP